MGRRGRIAAFLGVTALGALGALAFVRSSSTPTPVALRGALPIGSVVAPKLDAARGAERRGSLDVTFIAASDTHLGFESGENDALGRLHDPVASPRGVEIVNLRSIRAMNALPGSAWPAPLEGAIGVPQGVIVSGDLTENGDPWSWKHFVAYYGLRGGDGLLNYPVYEGHGNHDKHHSWYVLERVRERHGGTRYSFDWEDLHMVNLGEAPDDEGLAFLADDLEKVGSERPVILYFHFPLLGPYAEDNWFGEGDYRGKLKKTLAPYNIIAIFHGHYHASGRYTWEGYDIYNVGAAKHEQHSFAFVRVTDETLRVASYQHRIKTFEWWHEKPINGSSAPTRSGGSRADRGLLFGR